MKDSKTIISHIKKHPNMEILKQKECESKLLSLLPQSLSNSIKFIYTKHDTLFFVLNHAAAKMEFNYKRNLIKGLLKQLKNFHPDCECIDKKELRAFVTNAPASKLYTPKNSLIFYKERASGNFDNKIKDAKLHALFEKIKEEIRQQND